MVALQAGDEQAFDRLLDRHLDPIHRYLLRQIGNAADADELSQETFLRLWTEAERFNPAKARFTTWLHRIAHNLMIDRLRRQRPEDPVDEQAIEPPVDAAADAQWRWLNQAMARLPDNQRAAVALVYLQGFSNKEAAVIMDIGVRALESLLARGKRSLTQIQAEESTQ